MAPTSAKGKKAAPAKASKADKKEAVKESKSKAKAADDEETEGAPSVDVDALEEQEEQEEEAAAAASSGGGNAAALAAASGTGEMSASFKNFRHHPDMENFYRFIFENDLRHEALAIIDEIIIEKQNKKAAPGGKRAH